MTALRFLCGLIAALVAALPTPTRAADDELVIGMSQFPATMHPNIEAMLAKSYVLGATQRQFTSFDADWQLVCDLCESLPTFENGAAVVETQPDGTKGVALAFTIKNGAAWGDGTPVSTADVLFTWEVGRHPDSGVGNAELYRRIRAIDVQDDRRFVMHVTKLTFDYNGINDFRLLPAHLERPIFERDPATYRTRTLYDTDPTNPGLWFGPYRVTRYTPGVDIVLEPNPTWYGHKPYFSKVTIRTIENTAALEANLLAGQIDMIEGSLGLTVDQALSFERRNGERFQVVFKPGLIYEHIDLNLDNPILADLRVRQALLYGIDRKTMVDQLFGGRQPVAATDVHPLDWMYADDVAQYPYDPAKAAALLDEAGWKPGPDGIRVNAAGDGLRLEISTTAGNRSRELVEQALQSYWRKLGIDLAIANQPARVFFSDLVSKRKFESMVMFASVTSPENVPRSALHSEEIPTEANAWSGQNYSGFKSERMDALLDSIEVELDKEKRRALWHELQALYAQQLPSLPLYFRADPHIWPRWLDGVVPTGNQTPVTQSIETWRRAAP